MTKLYAIYFLGKNGTVEVSNHVYPNKRDAKLWADTLALLPEVSWARVKEVYLQ